MAEPRKEKSPAARAPSPRLDLTGLEWKLAVVAVLAGAYALLWGSLPKPTAASSPSSEPSQGPESAFAGAEPEAVAATSEASPLPPPPAGFAWVPADRAGLASNARVATASATTPARSVSRPAAQPRRVRTRSS